MIKVMIVDDEYHIRNGIKQSIPWSELSLELIGEAVDGNVAFELYKALQPDIVLLDINIPFRNGLEFARYIREKNKDTQIVFLTGYDDFDKVKEAVTLQASDYLLKPVSYGELIDALHKAIGYVRDLRQKKLYLHDLEQKVTDYGQVASDQLLMEFLQQRHSLGEITQQLLEWGIHWDIHSSFGVMCLEIDDFYSYMNQVTQRDRQLYLYAYRKLAQEVLEQWGRGYTLSDSPSRLVLLVDYGDAAEEEAESHSMNIAKQLQTAYHHYLKMSVSIGVSLLAAEAGNLHQAYRESIQAVEHRTLIGNGNIIPYRFVEPATSRGQQLLSKELYLLSEMRGGNDAGVVSILNDWSLELRNRSLTEAKLVASQIFIFVMRLVEEVGIRNNEVGQTDPFLELTRCQTIDHLISFVSTYLVAVGKAVRESKENPSLKVIEQAKQWIRDHLSEEVSLARLSSYLHMSPNYLSLLFKQATGETFIDFTTRKRFERAKELLAETSLKVREVAEMVGYSDSNYFSIAFKKHQGMTPTEYRHRFV